MEIALFGIYFNLFELALLLVVTGNALFMFTYEGSKIQIRNSSALNIWLLLFLLYLLAVLFSSLAAVNHYAVVKAFVKWLGIFIFSFLIFLYVRNCRRFKFIYWTLWLANFIVVGLVITDIALGQSSLLDYRIFPGFPSVIALGLILPFIRSKQKLLPLVVSLLLLVAAVLSLSRGVWVILFVYGLLLIKKSQPKVRLLIVGTLSVLALGIFFYTPIGTLIELRLQSTQASSTERLGMAKLALDAFQSHPLTGVGSLNFPAYLMANAGRNVIRSDNPEKLQPHNLFLQTAAEEGVLGLLTIVAILAIGSYHILRSARFGEKSPEIKHHLEGMQYLLVVILSNACFGYISDHMRFVFVIFLGLSMSMLRMATLSAHELREKI